MVVKCISNPTNYFAEVSLGFNIFNFFWLRPWLVAPAISFWLDVWFVSWFLHNFSSTLYYNSSYNGSLFHECQQTLHESIEGTSRDRRAIVRVMISRAEVDLTGIQSVFKRKYDIELRDSICKSITPDDYRDFLTALASKSASSASSV